jgi:hypothetical protein
MIMKLKEEAMAHGGYRASEKKMSRRGLSHLIPDPFQIIIYQSSYHFLLYILDIESMIEKVGL